MLSRRTLCFLNLAVFLALGTAVTGCFPEGIGDVEVDDPVQASLEGVWVYGATLAGSGATCSVTGMEITIRQTTETVFEGTTAGGQFECIHAGRIQRGTLPSFEIEDGQVVGLTMRMSFQSSDFWRNAGTVSTAGMGGVTDWHRDFGGDIGVIHLSQGDWSATRR